MCFLTSAVQVIRGLPILNGTLASYWESPAAKKREMNSERRCPKPVHGDEPRSASLFVHVKTESNSTGCSVHSGTTIVLYALSILYVLGLMLMHFITQPPRRVIVTPLFSAKADAKRLSRTVVCSLLLNTKHRLAVLLHVYLARLRKV